MSVKQRELMKKVSDLAKIERENKEFFYSTPKLEKIKKDSEKKLRAESDRIAKIEIKKIKIIKVKRNKEKSMIKYRVSDRDRVVGTYITEKEAKMAYCNVIELYRLTGAWDIIDKPELIIEEVEI